MRNDIKDEGGIPGFVVLAEEMVTSSDPRESRARFRAFSVLFVADEAYMNSNIMLDHYTSSLLLPSLNCLTRDVKLPTSTKV